MVSIEKSSNKTASLAIPLFHRSHLGKAVAAEAGDRHEVDVLDRIATLFQMLTETPEGPSFKLFHNRRGQLIFNVVCGAGCATGDSRSRRCAHGNTKSPQAVPISILEGGAILVSSVCESTVLLFVTAAAKSFHQPP